MWLLFLFVVASVCAKPHFLDVASGHLPAAPILNPYRFAPQFSHLPIGALRRQHLCGNVDRWMNAKAIQEYMIRETDDHIEVFSSHHRIRKGILHMMAIQRLHDECGTVCILLRPFVYTVSLF